jgi:hypothetical protein
MMPSMARQARLPVVSWNFIALQETILRPNASTPNIFEDDKGTSGRQTFQFGRVEAKDKASRPFTNGILERLVEEPAEKDVLNGDQK